MSERVSSPWNPTSSWADRVPSGRHGTREGAAGVHLVRVETASLATIIVRPGCQDQLSARLRERFDCELAPTGCVRFGRGGDIVWSAPGQWLVVQREDVSRDVREICWGVASLTDQGSSRALVEVSGPDARETLAKGVAIDLDPTVFSTGRTAVTALAHMNVQLWQTDDSPRFMIAVPRSFAGSFWSWLASAAATYGYEAGSRTCLAA